MFRDNYKKAFSQINPSDETVERIFEMTEKKHSKKLRKGLIIAIAIIAVLLLGTLTVNAATDGALFDPPISFFANSNAINLISGDPVNKTSYVDENGNKVDRYDFDTDGDGEVDYSAYAILNPDGSGQIVDLQIVDLNYLIF